MLTLTENEQTVTFVNSRKIFNKIFPQKNLWIVHELLLTIEI